MGAPDSAVMRGCLAMAFVAGARAFSAPALGTARAPAGVSSAAWEADAPWRGGVPRSTPQPAGPVAATSFGSGAAALAVIAALGSSLRRQTRKPRAARHYVVGAEEAKDKPELMTGEVYYGGVDKDGSRNYVNPWEERVGKVEELSENMTRGYGWSFVRYKGPVYKQVPVIEGLKFPLDPEVYDAKYGLEPPPPGAKFGDGRDPADGNWYMEVDGQKEQYWQGVGRRKTACAVVRILKGTGQFFINGTDGSEYLQRNPFWWMKGVEPICAMNEKNNFDIIVKAFGGGLSGRAGAIRLGLARAMQEYNYQWRPFLRRSRYLTRDWRMIEPKKTGRPKARKKKPYHKR